MANILQIIIQAEDRASKQLEGVAKSAGDMSKRLQTTAIALTAVGAAITGSMVAMTVKWASIGDEIAKLEAAVNGTLKRAEGLELVSIAFPAISTGIFGFPVHLAAQVMFSTINKYLENNPASKVNLVRVVLFDRETQQAFEAEWEQDDHLGA